MEKATKNFKYKVPKVVKHSETKDMMKGIVAELVSREVELTAADIPFLNRLATSYDQYWDSVVYLSQHDMIAVNKKGEEVKHPMVNIGREAWTQFLSLAKEYGLTVASSVKIKAKAPTSKDDADAPIKKFIHK